MDQQKPITQGAIGATAGDTARFGFDDQAVSAHGVKALLKAAERATEEVE